MLGIVTRESQSRVSIQMSELTADFRVFLYYQTTQFPYYINHIFLSHCSNLTPLWMRSGGVVVAAILKFSLRNITVNLLNFLLNVYYKI